MIRRLLALATLVALPHTALAAPSSPQVPAEDPPSVSSEAPPFDMAVPFPKDWVAGEQMEQDGVVMRKFTLPGVEGEASDIVVVFGPMGDMLDHLAGMNYRQAKAVGFEELASFVSRNRVIKSSHLRVSDGVLTLEAVILARSFPEMSGMGMVVVCAWKGGPNAIHRSVQAFDLLYGTTVSPR